MAVQTLSRIFEMDKDGKIVKLPDPNPRYTPEEVLDHYSMQYPNLTTAVAVPDKQVGKTYVYKIEDTVGTKG